MIMPMANTNNTDPVSQLALPPGFRFYPTDEELLVQYLCRKVAGQQFSLQIIGEVDLYKFDPWVLPSKALFGEKEWYFFSPRDRKYPNGSRPNRVAGSGYWKATGTDKIIITEGRKIGIKKALVFYVGKAPKGSKTNWIMHEYRLSESTRKTGSSRLDEWVLCRIYKKNSGSGVAAKPESSVSTKEISNGSSSSASSHYDEVLESLPQIEDRSFTLPRINSLKTLQDEKFDLRSIPSGKFDWANLIAMTLPDLTNNNQTQKATDMHTIPPLCHVDSPPDKLGSSIEEEVESGFGGQRMGNTNSGFGSGLFQQNGLNHMFGDSLDQFGYRYLNNSVAGRYGFGQ